MSFYPIALFRMIKKKRGGGGFDSIEKWESGWLARKVEEGMGRKVQIRLKHFIVLKCKICTNFIVFMTKDTIQYINILIFFVEKKRKKGIWLDQNEVGSGFGFFSKDGSGFCVKSTRIRSPGSKYKVCAQENIKNQVMILFTYLSAFSHIGSGSGVVFSIKFEDW